MSPLPRTPDGKVVLTRLSTGQRHEHWPVDARELLASGDYSTDLSPEIPGDSPAVPDVAAPSTLPTKTPLDMPAVYSRAADVKSVGVMAAPVRSRGKK